MVFRRRLKLYGIQDKFTKRLITIVMKMLYDKDIGVDCNVTVLTLERTHIAPLNPDFPFIVMGAGEADRLYVKFHDGECIFSVARSDVSFPETEADTN